MRCLLLEYTGRLGSDLSKALAAAAEGTVPRCLTLPVDDDMLRQLAPDLEPDLTFELLAADGEFADSLKEAVVEIGKESVPAHARDMRRIVTRCVPSPMLRIWLKDIACIDADDFNLDDLHEAALANLADGTIPLGVLEEFI